jgi:hypothetical protein
MPDTLFALPTSQTFYVSGHGIPPTPLKKQGVFKVGGKKEKESDLLLIEFQKDHYFGFFKKC